MLIGQVRGDAETCEARGTLPTSAGQPHAGAQPRPTALQTSAGLPPVSVLQIVRINTAADAFETLGADDGRVVPDVARDALE